MLPIYGTERKRRINLGGQSTSSSLSSTLDQVKERRQLKRITDAAIVFQRKYRGLVKGRESRAQLKRACPGDVRVAALLGSWNGESLQGASPWVKYRISEIILGNITLLGAETLTTVLSETPGLLERLLEKDLYYPNISRTIRSINTKSDPILEHLVRLAVLPLPSYSADFLKHILSIPLLPNRLPLPILSILSSKITLPDEPVYGLPPEECAHILANLTMFVPAARYGKNMKLGPYLSLLTSLISALPPGTLDPPTTTTLSVAHIEDEDDEEEREQRPEQARLPLDPKTIKRLQSLTTSQHLSALLRVNPPRMQLCYFLLDLLAVCSPSRKSDALSAVLVTAGGGLIRELYRGYVRSADIASSENEWWALLTVASLHTHAMLTMGDDEFFGRGGTRGAPANPLTLDEIVSLSGKVMRIVWGMFWDSNVSEERVVKREILLKWLVSVHARDSRHSFTPTDHWIIPSTDAELTGFIEAAIFEDEQLSEETSNVRITNKQMAFLTPRLSVLRSLPFAIPFEVRVQIFRKWVRGDQMKHSQRTMPTHAMDMFRMPPRQRVQIRRTHISQDGFDRLGDMGMKDRLEISFLDQWGEEEAGIDGGGLFKEFFTSLCKEVFDTDRGLWRVNQKHELYPSVLSYAREPHSLNWYRFVGRILGKAMYEGILVDVAFAGFFLSKWLNKQSHIDDLASLDPDLYNGLVFLKHYEGDFAELAVNFSIGVEELGTTHSIDLIVNGSQIPVTRENRLQYIYLVANFRLNKQIKAQSDAFFEGLSELIEARWLKMFNQQELQILIGGVDTPVDLDDLRSHTHYGGLYDDGHEVIQRFWNVVNSFSQSERRALLRFVTSCSRPPLLGFKELQPQFSIRDAGSDDHRLPTSSTCVNLLKLPRYSNERVLHAKLLQAINSGAGFDLS